MTSTIHATESPSSPAAAPRRRPVFQRLGALPPWSLLAVGTLAGGLAGGAYGALTPPAYSATAYVVAVPAAKSDPQAALGVAQAYGRVATQLAVLADAQVWAGVPVRTLRQSVRSATSPDAPMVAVTATAARADLAVDMANAVTRAMIHHADRTKHATQIGLKQFSRAVRPTEPSSASPVLTGLVGASAGGLLGGLALLIGPRRTTAGDTRPAVVPAPATAADAHSHS
ncbi:MULTISPECIES: lipopolysaccharide biosynthesis protein [Streptomyces]|uniref:lipopolysaccharide biosynthesis protein n=1 Tax=Streptomyces TaxID=1883 RepID=UPI001E4E4405|nr:MULTISPECIES: lipopolysaccharide biosynthesis protein [Streptomyces]